MGSWGAGAKAFLSDVGSRVKQATGNPRALEFLRQRVSIEIQRGNAASGMSILAALTGVWLTGGDNNIFTQIGLMVLVGLACKNAILIVEFARELELQGHSPRQAAIDASRLRLRPILMTSIAFIMGVVPLVTSTGAGAEMRHAMGIAVFFGMLGVTLFGLFLTPVFYVLLRTLDKRHPLHSAAAHEAPLVAPVHAHAGQE